MQNVVILKNTFQKFVMVNEIINSCKLMNVPNGNCGTIITSKFVQSLIVRKTIGSERVMDTIYLDPDLVTKQDMDKVAAAKNFAEQYNFRLEDIVDWFIDGAQLPPKDELDLCVKLSFDTKYTSVLWLHTIKSFKLNPDMFVASTDRLTLLTDWLASSK